jgi:hypothetical protein
MMMMMTMMMMTMMMTIYSSNTSKHDSFASLLYEVHVEKTVSLHTSAEFERQRISSSMRMQRD